LPFHRTPCSTYPDGVITLQQVNSIGCAAGIQTMEDGLLAGYADGRGEGLAAGY